MGAGSLTTRAGGMKRRIRTAAAASTAAVAAVTTLSAAPAHAAGEVCSNYYTFVAGVTGRVCVSATVNNQTLAGAKVWNNTNHRVPVEIVLYLNYNGANHPYAVAGTGHGDGVPGPNGWILASQPNTRWSPSGRRAVAEIRAAGVYRVISTPVLF